MAFREGLDGTERDCELLLSFPRQIGSLTFYPHDRTVFGLAQGSVKMMKQWHEMSEMSRR